MLTHHAPWQNAAKDPIFLAARDAAEVCIVSPLARTLETAAGVTAGTEIPLLACPLLQECADCPCDTGRSPEVLKREYPTVDFAQVPPLWYEKVGHIDFGTGQIREAGLAALRTRCEAATEFLCGRSEETLVVVAHHTFFAHLTGVEFFNCEVIEFSLAPTGPWRERWTVAKAAGEVVDLYKADGTRWSWTGSAPLRGTLATCAKMGHLGPDAARVTAEHAGLQYGDDGGGGSLGMLVACIAVAALAVYIARKQQ